MSQDLLAWRINLTARLSLVFILSPCSGSTLLNVSVNHATHRSRFVNIKFPGDFAPPFYPSCTRDGGGRGCRCFRVLFHMDRKWRVTKRGTSQYKGIDSKSIEHTIDDYSRRTEKIAPASTGRARKLQAQMGYINKRNMIQTIHSNNLYSQHKVTVWQRRLGYPTK